VLAAHHGSGKSSDATFIAATGARYALVSAGHGNRFGHPHPHAVQRWRDAGAQVPGTAEYGALRIRFGVDGIHVQGERERRRRFWDAAKREKGGQPAP